MSYIAFRDNKDLASLPGDAYDRLVPLGDLIEASNLEAFHQSECGCAEFDCPTSRSMPRPSTEEVLGWLVAKGLLDLNARPVMPVRTARDKNGQLVLVCPYTDCGQSGQIREEDQAIRWNAPIFAAVTKGALYVQWEDDSDGGDWEHHRFLCIACARPVLIPERVELPESEPEEASA